jgi:Putative phage integrase
MTIVLEFVNDENVRRDPDEPGSMFNPSSNIYVQLRALSMEELRQEWKTFDTLLRKAFIDLFSMKVSEVRAKYGALDISEKGIKGRADIEFGLAYSRAAARFTHFPQGELVKGLVAIGAVPATTPHGKPRQRLRCVGGVASFVEKLEPDLRSGLIATLLESDASLDEVLKLNQTSLIGDREIAEYLASARNPAVALERTARNTDSFFNEQQTAGKDSYGRGDGRTFAWAWFAQYLSMREIWLQPIGNIKEILNLYPRKVGPIAAWMAVPAFHRGLAESVWSRMEASRGTSAATILSVFLSLAQSSNAFARNKLVKSPLIFFKEWVSRGGGSSEVRSSSTNELYKLLCRHFGLNAASQPGAEFFFGGRRIGKLGVEAFAWCDHPNKRNTAVAERCLGRPVDTVPLYVRDWAEDFRWLLSSFGNKSVDNDIGRLNTWLIFLLHLGESRAPKSFPDVSRSRHVNNLSPDGDTYINFLARHFSQTNRQIANRAVSTLAKAWKLAATRDNYAARGSPFDITLDRIGKAPKRRAKSVRRPLDQVVMEILVRENRRNDFELARTMGEPRPTYLHVMKNPTTQAYEEIFFPLSPIIIDIILHSGMRKFSARWLDSGEGDEFSVDIAAKIDRPNLLPTATKGRREGFLRICEFVEKGGRRRELGMFMNTNKTGVLYEVPWIDPELAAHVDRLAKLQTTYNPIEAPIPARDPDISELYGHSGSVPTVFPLFRNPHYDRHLPVSDAMVRSYWLALLKHCEPIVEHELGYSYPLVIDDKALFDIHALRITTVTVLHESGVSIDIIQALVGHSSVMMTWYYRQVRHAELHRALNKAYAERGKRVVSDGDELTDQLVEEAIAPLGVDDPVGLALLQEHRSAKSAPIDVFAHGICPGGDCNTGGKRLAEGRHAPVFRQRACSRCRFRVTGPMFLNGLVHRLNGLMFEIKQSSEKEQQLNAEADMAEDSNKASSHLRALARRERESRDALFEEWCAELQTIKACQAALEKGNGENRFHRALMPARSDFDPETIDLTFKHVHQFELVQNIVVTAHLIPETQLDLPPGAEETRDNILYRILHHNDLNDLLFRIDKNAARRALDTLGDLLIANAGDQSQLQAIIEGAVLFKDLPALQDAAEQLRLAIVQSQTSIWDHGNDERQ